jgi:hypothetical protein
MKHLIEKYLFLHAIMEINEHLIDIDAHGVTEEEVLNMDDIVSEYIENLDMEQIEKEMVELLKLFPKKESVE